jgi:hypothetical protein
MSDGLKSSLDVALERMKKIVGEDEVSLSDDQKRRIAEVKRDYEAKAAEKKILLAGSEELTAELQRVSQEKEEKIKAIYADET